MKIIKNTISLLDKKDNITIIPKEKLKEIFNKYDKEFLRKLANQLMFDMTDEELEKAFAGLPKIDL